MQWRNTGNRYGAIAQSLHWLVVLLILTQFLLADTFKDLPLGMEKITWIVRHKAVGMTILLLACLRLGWRLFNPAPPLPAHMRPYERWAAHGSHFLLYALIFAIPLSGWLMSSFANIPVSYFGWFDIPIIAAPNKAWVDTSKEVHEILNLVLIGVVCLHIAAALFHHFIRKDDVLIRMLPME
jgi:cytochrome b561